MKKRNRKQIEKLKYYFFVIKLILVVALILGSMRLLTYKGWW